MVLRECVSTFPSVELRGIYFISYVLCLKLHKSFYLICFKDAYCVVNCMERTLRKLYLPKNEFETCLRDPGVNGHPADLGNTWRNPQSIQWKVLPSLRGFAPCTCTQGLYKQKIFCMFILHRGGFPVISSRCMRLHGEAGLTFKGLSRSIVYN